MNYSLRHIKRILRDIKDSKLSVPAGFWEHSPQWVRRHYNGIGADWMPRFVRAWATKILDKLEAPSLVHDIEYLDTDKTYWKFTKANFRLWRNAIKKKRFFIGGFCALLCQLFGWSAYRDGKESMAYYYFYREK